MDNYKDRFTPEQLERLRHSALVGSDLKDWERIIDVDAEAVPAVLDTAFSGDVVDIFRELFDQNRPEPPKDLEDEEEYFIWLDEEFFKFTYDVLNEIFKGEITPEEAKDTARAIALYGENSALTLITDKKLQSALLPRKNKHAYIINLDNQLQFIWDKDGTPHITTEDEEEAFKKLLERKEIPAKCADVELLETLLSAVLTSYKHNYGDEITVYYPNFVKALGTRTGGKEEHRADVKQKLRELENTAGVLVEQKKIQRAFVLLEVDEKENTITFKSPYLYSICDFLKKNPSKVSEVIKNDRPTYKIEGFSYLVRTEIASAKNKTTAQIVKFLIAGLHQNGNRTNKNKNPQKEFNDPKARTWAVSYMDLIKYTPLLKEAIMKSPSHKTEIIKNAVLGKKYEPAHIPGKYHPETIVEEYLRKYTLAFDYWKDLKITFKDISAKNLNNSIVLTHHGVNGDSKDELNLPDIIEGLPDEES